jgi:hypothetical protein
LLNDVTVWHVVISALQIKPLSSTMELDCVQGVAIIEGYRLNDGDIF